MRTAESLSQTPERSGVSLKDFGKGKLGHQIGVIGMERALSAAFADIREENSCADVVKLYRLFTKALPYSISNENQLETLQAMESEDPNISSAATAVFTLLNMRTILKAAEPYFTKDPDENADLVQAGITYLLHGVTGRTQNHPEAIYQFIYTHVQTGIAQEIATRENLPVGWVRNNVHTKTAKLIEESFVNYPLGMQEEHIAEVANVISETTGVTTASVQSVIKDKHTLLTSSEGLAERSILDEEDLIDIAFLDTQKQAIMEVLTLLGNRQATVIKARFFEDATLTEAGERLGLKGHSGASTACQIEARALRTLRHPKFGHQLKPYYFPERYGIIRKPK